MFSEPLLCLRAWAKATLLRQSTLAWWPGGVWGQHTRPSWKLSHPGKKFAWKSIKCLTHHFGGIHLNKLRLLHCCWEHICLSLCSSKIDWIFVTSNLNLLLRSETVKGLTERSGEVWIWERWRTGPQTQDSQHSIKRKENVCIYCRGLLKQSIYIQKYNPLIVVLFDQLLSS